MRFTFALLLLLGFANKSNGQQLELVGSSGVYTVTSGLGISWSIGEVVILTGVNATNAVTQGYQQGDVYSLDINRPVGSDLNLTVYPNPTVGYVQIEASSAVGLNIFSTQGKLLRTIQINSNHTQVDLSAYPRGNYFFHFADESGIQFKVMRVIKN